MQSGSAQFRRYCDGVVSADSCEPFRETRHASADGELLAPDGGHRRLGAAAQAQQVSDGAQGPRGQLVERLESPTRSRPATRPRWPLIEARAAVLPAPARRGWTRRSRPVRKRGSSRVRDGASQGRGADQPRRVEVTIKGKGIRLTEAIQHAPEAVGQPRSPTSASRRRRGDQPGARPGDRRQAVLRGVRHRRRARPGVALQFYSGDGSIGIMAGAIARRRPRWPSRWSSTPARSASQFKQIGASSETSRPARPRPTPSSTSAWEPRLRPMLLKLKADELKIVDDQGQGVKPQVWRSPTRSSSGPRTRVAEINLNLVAPDRAAKSFKSLQGQGRGDDPRRDQDLPVPQPGGEERHLKAGRHQRDPRVTEVDEQTWKVHVDGRLPGEGPAFESYRQGLFNNRIWLQKADGSRFEQNGGFNSTGSDGGKLGFEYLFVDAPGKPADYCSSTRRRARSSRSRWIRVQGRPAAVRDGPAGTVQMNGPADRRRWPQMTREVG